MRAVRIFHSHLHFSQAKRVKKKKKKKAFETCLEGEKVRGKKKKISESDEKTKKHKNLLTEFQEFLVRVSYELFKLYRAI